MAEKREKMLCPDCGVEMNYHADKIDYAAEPDEREEALYGGRLEEAHTCPVCGRTHMRHAATQRETE